MRGLRRSLWSSLSLSMTLLLTTFTPALAHSGLVRSVPAAGERLAESPLQVALWFDGELVTKESTLKVFNEDDRQVDVGDGYVDLNDPDHASMIVTLPQLPEGVYTVRWRAVYSEDSDVAEGEFDFIVGNATPRVKSTTAIAPPKALPTENASNVEGSTPDWLLIGIMAGGTIVLILMTLGLRRSRKTS